MSNEMNKRAHPVQTKGWDKVISAVRTPLGYAVFAGLSGLLILPMGMLSSDEENKSVLIGASLILIFVSIIYVFVMSAIRPEALKGERMPQEVTKQKNALSIPEQNEKDSVLRNLEKLGIMKIGFFEDFTESFPNRIQSSQTMTTMFIHSRRWRENNNAMINQFLLKERSRIIIFLPDLNNKELIEQIKRHFDDGDHLEFFISDAFRYYSSLKTRFPEKIDVRCFSLYPTYSLYKFDDSAIIAMYPTTTKRRSVPTLEITSEGDFWGFLGDDMDLLLETFNAHRN